MTVEYKIEKRHDDRGATVFFLTGNGADLTSRWTREDAAAALAEIQSMSADKSSSAGPSDPVVTSLKACA